MKRKAFTIFGMLLALTLALALVLPGQAMAKKKVFKLGHPMGPQSAEGMGVDRFAELVKQKSNGELEVQVFHSSQLGKTLEMVEGVMMGSIDLTMEDITLYDKHLPVVRIMGMLYYFKDRAQMHKFLASEIWQKEFVKPVEKLGIKVIGTKWNWDRGPYRTLISRKPIFTLDDLKDVKLRIWEVETIRKGWGALGAVPIVISWSEAYLALRQGVADAITCPIGLLYPAKFTEVLKYVTITKQFPQTMCFGMNIDRFNSLSPEEQQIMIDSANEAGEYFSMLYRKRAEEDIEKMMCEHGAFFIQTCLDPWRAKAQEAREKLEESGYLPKGLWDKINSM